VKARIGLVPVALLGAGCSLRPWTPSVSVAYWSEDVPAARDYDVPTSIELARAWQLPAELPWSRYMKQTLVSSVDPMKGKATLPDVRQLEVVGEAEAAAAQLARVGLPVDTLWILDLRGAASCAFVSRLSRESKEPIAPVITFNNWPATESIVPADESLAGLLAFPPKLPPPEARNAHPFFVLDSWRLAYRFDDPGDGTFDNRYMLMPGDLPDAATLQAQGITRIVYVVEDLDDAEVEEDDLHASFRAWQGSGIAIHLVDLPFLKDLASWRSADWAARLAPRSHWVRERYTLVDDSTFYWRARAGFGLYYGHPIILPGYRSGYGGYYGGGGGRGGYGGPSGG
jgi:hypothetical protein